MAEINLIKLSQSGGGPSLVDVNFNGTLEGQADTTIPIEVNLTDGVNPVTPTSVALTGNDLDIVIPAPIVPSGVLFQTVEPSQYTSYRTGDEGWRVQNNWYDYTPPTNPKAIAELDYSIGANYFYKLKNPLIVNGVSSTTRFVDLNGVQVFGATNNVNAVFLDKLTGMMITRLTIAGQWNACIDGALIYSITINSIVYDDFYCLSLPEAVNIFGTFLTITNWVDPITTNTIRSGNGVGYLSTTTPNDTNNAYLCAANAIGANYGATGKTAGGNNVFYIQNARNLITAP
jgi:hypothetical protein